MELDELLNIADQVLVSESSNDDFIELVEVYGQGFDNWFATNKNNIEKKLEFKSSERLDELLRKHEAILAKTSSIQAGIPGEIRELKHKFKGIKAYIDYFPSSISVHKSRKG
jgi:predicted HTH transcriptional regulator